MPPKTKAKAKGRVRPVNGYTNEDDFSGELTFIVSRHSDPSDDRGWTLPVSVHLLTPEAEEARVEAGAKAIHEGDVRTKSGFFKPWSKMTESYKHNLRANVRAVLRALGLAKR